MSSSSSSSGLTSLKLSFNGEIRRISVDLSASLTYDQLVTTTQRIFPSISSIQLSWMDDESDKVVIDSDDELFEALRVMTTEKKGYLRFEVTAKPGHSNTDNSIPAVAKFGTIIHEDVECNQCGQHPIIGFRFKCTVRHNFDLCATCEEKGQHPYPTLKIYAPGQAPAAILAVVDEEKGRRGQGKGTTRNGKHRGVTCDVCHSRNFTGYRYMCSVRPNFDLCSTCEASPEVQPFAMIKFYRPNQLKSIEVIPRGDPAAGAATAYQQSPPTPAQQHEQTPQTPHTKLQTNIATFVVMDVGRNHWRVFDTSALFVPTSTSAVLVRRRPPSPTPCSRFTPAMRICWITYRWVSVTAWDCCEALLLLLLLPRTVINTR